MSKIGFIGIGHMGRPMAQRLVDAGHELSVYDVDQNNAEKVSGAEVAKSSGELASGKEFVFSMLPFSDDTIEVLTDDNGALSAADKDCVFIDLGTGSPSLTWFLSRRIKEDGCEYLDCPVSGEVELAEKGNLMLVASGKKDVFERTREIFEILADRVHYMGEENGLGMLTKLSLNVMLATNMVALCESLNFGEKSGVDKNKLFEVMADSQIISESLKLKLDSIKNEKYSSEFQNYLMDKDLIYINEVAEFVKSPMSACSAAWQTYRTAIMEGLDSQDYSSVNHVIRQMNFGIQEKKKAA